MKNKETFLGNVNIVNGTSVSITITKDSLSGFIYIDGQGYRIGQIGSFVRIPIGFIDLFGLITQVGSGSVSIISDNSDNSLYNWMNIQLIGESKRNGSFSRGISQYPTLGDEVHLLSEKELFRIYGHPNKPYFLKIGNISNAESIPALIDINKLVTRHSAILGTTGSGKSTTVASLVNALSDIVNYPSSRILILDIHGEYGSALHDKANIFKINALKNSKYRENELFIPYWALNFDELCEICFGEITDEKSKNLILERVQNAKLDSLNKYPKLGINQDSLSVDSPIPFNIHELWYNLYVETFGTYYSKNTNSGRPIDNLAFDLDAHGNEKRGSKENGIPPIFKNVKNDKDDPEKINYLPNALNIGKQLQLLGSKLRIPRYNFIFKPKDWYPSEDGNVIKDIDLLLKEWIGSNKPVSILDLSGVPSDILQTTIGVLLRLLYEALFWSRNLSQGGRHRPLLLIMEEAHIYLNSDSKGMASSIVQRIVKEGRKYGIGAMIVSQRPSEVNSTILSQCGTIFALRLANSLDRGQVTSTLSDNLEGLTNMLPILKTGEAIIIGESVKLPMKTNIDPPPINRRPDSQDPVIFDEILEPNSQNPGGWGNKMEENPNYEEIVETWRSQNTKISKIID